MPISYATRHKQAHQQARRGQVSTAPVRAEHNSSPSLTYRTQLVKLEADKSQLSNIRSKQRKQALKRELLPAYRDYIQLVINQDSGLQDEILVTLLVWCIDAGEYSDALLIAGYVIQHRLSAPDNFTRNLAEVISEEISDNATRSASPADFVDTLQQVEAMTSTTDMSDVIRAKLYKALALSVKDDTPREALEYAQLARNYHQKIAVSRLIKQLKKQLSAGETEP